MRGRSRGRGSASGGRPQPAPGPAPRPCSTRRAECLRALGAVVIDPVELPDIDKVTEPEFEALDYEFKHGINSYLKYLAAFADNDGPGLPGTLADLIDFNQRNAATVLARFGQEIFQTAEATSGDLADPVYLELRGAASLLARTAVEAPVSSTAWTLSSC